MARDPLEHWPGCPRALVLPRTHPDGRRTVTCWQCQAQVTYSPNGRVLSTYRPTDPPAWTHIPEENR